MKKSVILILILFIATELQAQQQSTPKDSIILRRLFHSIGRGFKKIDQHAKTVALNSKQHYHDTPHSTNTIDKRFSMALNAGTNYYGDFGQNYYPFDTGQIIRPHYSVVENAYGKVSYTHVPGLGFHGVFVCALRITRAFSIENGLMYFSRRSKIISSSDTTERNIVNAFCAKYMISQDYRKECSQNTQSLEIPVYFCYSNKRFSAMMGARFILFSIYHEKTTMIDNSVQNYKKTSYPFERYTSPVAFTTPSIKLRCMVIREKIPVSIYLTADRHDYKVWDFLAGVQVGIFSR